MEMDLPHSKASYLIFLYLSFFIFRMGTITVPILPRTSMKNKIYTGIWNIYGAQYKLVIKDIKWLKSTETYNNNNVHFKVISQNRFKEK